MSDLRNVLQRIYEERGKLTPTIVLDEARDPGSPIHHRFEWDDAIAGERYRLHQAGGLIRSVRVAYAVDNEGREKSVRGWVSLHRSTEDEDEEPSRAYRPTAEIIEDPFARRLVLAEFEREWKSFRARYQHLKEFADVVLADVQEVA